MPWSLGARLHGRPSARPPDQFIARKHGRLQCTNSHGTEGGVGICAGIAAVQTMLLAVDRFDWRVFLVGLCVMVASDALWLAISTQRSWVPWSTGYANVRESGARDVGKGGVACAIAVCGAIASATGAAVQVEPRELRPALGAALGAVVFGIYNATTLIADKRWAKASAAADVVYGTGVWALLYWIQGL